MLLALIAAGYWYWKQVSFTLPLNRTTQGILLEELMPQDASLVMSFNPTDAVERDRFSKLVAALLQDKKDAVLPYIAEEIFHQSGNLADLTHAISAIGGNFKAGVAVRSGTTGTPGDILLLVSVDDPQTLRVLLQKPIGNQVNGHVTKNTEKEFLLSYESAQPTYVGIAGDVLFITNTSSQADAVFARFQKKMLSILRQKEFRAVSKKLTFPLSGYAYINKFMSSSLVSFAAQEGGLFMNMLSEAERKNKDSPFWNLMQPYSASLYKRLPAQALIFFSESHHLGSIIWGELEVLKSMAGFSKEGMLSSINGLTGFDYYADLLPFLSGPFAMTIHDSGTIMPGITLVIDASASTEKAGEVIKKLDAQVQNWVALGNMALKAKEGQLILEAEKFKTIKQGGLVKIFASRISDEVNPAPLFKLMTIPLEVSYGITEDHLLFFSTLPSIEKALSAQHPIEIHPLFQEMQGWGIAPGSVTLFDGAVLGSYVNRLVDMARDQKSFSEINEQTYAILQKHLSPIKGLIQISQGDGKNVTGKAFLKIKTGL